MAVALTSSDGDSTRNLLRIASVILIGLGLVLTLAFWSAAQASFESFRSSGPFGASPEEPPFMLAVVGGMLLFGGIALARFAFLRPVATYAAREVAPAVEVIAQSAAAGAKTAQQRACLACGAVNDHDARFCDACGKAMPQQGTVS